MCSTLNGVVPPAATLENTCFPTKEGFTAETVISRTSTHCILAYPLNAVVERFRILPRISLRKAVSSLTKKDRTVRSVQVPRGGAVAVGVGVGLGGGVTMMPDPGPIVRVRRKGTVCVAATDT